MKKICLLLLLAFCMSFCPVVSADVNVSSDVGVYVNGIYAYNGQHSSFSTTALPFSVKRNYDFGNGYSCEIYDSDYTSTYNNYTYFGLRVYEAGEICYDKESAIICDPGDEDTVILKTAIYYNPSSNGESITLWLCYTDEVRYTGASNKLFEINVADIDFTAPTLTMTLNNVSDPLTDSFYVEVDNKFRTTGWIKTQYQAKKDDEYKSVNELKVPAMGVTKFRGSDLKITKAGIYTFSLYDPDGNLKGIKTLTITAEYIAGSNASITMTLNNVSDPLTDDFYVEVDNKFSKKGYLKTQYQKKSTDDYMYVSEYDPPASNVAVYTANKLGITSAGIYTFSLYDPDGRLVGIKILTITSDYAISNGSSGSDDNAEDDLFNFTELPEDANILDYIKWICTNMIELFKGLGRCIKNFVTQTKEMSSILTKFFSFMPTEFTLILTLGMMFLVLLRFLGR